MFDYVPLSTVTIPDEERTAAILDIYPQLTAQQARMLAVLLAAPNRFLTHAHISEALFNMTSEYPSSMAIRDHIRRIRRKIPDAPFTIESKYSIGYRLLLRPDPAHGCYITETL